tara:strand:+ start:4686 stop:5171 length:486 start_codon:yes stop_codon:yes gene_type:complete
MASVTAFTSILEEFLDDLIKIYPNDEKIKSYKENFDSKKDSDGKELLDGFLAGVKGDVGKLIVEKKSQFFKKSVFAKKLNLHTLFKEMTPQTKQAVWQYLNTMYVLSTTISNIPSNLLSTIETMAEQCASQMAEGNTETNEMPDMSTLLAGMQNMMKSMGK